MATSVDVNLQASLKVLVVDDSELSREITRDMLEEHGFSVIIMETSIGMSRTLAVEKPDLVLMDVDMPALEGDKAVAIARRHSLHVCPIVLYSARKPKELETLARSCGADGFVCKTSDADVLAQAVRQHLKR
jgi:DNA-binding response OmpR family regulator